MSSKILINGNIYFDCSNNVLIVLNENNRVVKLNQPVSRCLSILIAQHPAVVKQAELFKYIWGDEASQIPANALYQNISLLRRSLANASAALSDVVITVPRAGFRLSSEVQISAESTCDEKSDVSDIPLVRDSDITDKLPPGPVVKKRSTTGLVIYIFGILAAGFVLIWTAFHASQDGNRSLFDSYTLATEHNGCKIYAYPDFVQNNQVEFNGYFKKFNITCTELNRAYLSVNTPRTRVSVMYCSDILARAKTCVTHIYWNDSK